MATPSWLVAIAGGCIAREHDDNILVHKRQKLEEEDWYPFLLNQLSLLQPEKLSGTVASPPSAQKLKPGWEPAEEPEPALSRSSSGFARFAALKRSASIGMQPNRISAALSSFRMVEAFEEMEVLQATANDDLRPHDVEDIERICRIGGRASKHLSWWSKAGCVGGGIGDGWPISGRSDSLQLEWGFRVENGLIHAAFSTQVQGDLTKAVAALSELQLYGSFNDEFVEGSSLEEDGPANDTIWRLVTHNKVLDIRADNIWQVSVTDALAEPAGIVIVDLSAPEEEGATELRGTPLPKKHEGFSRLTCGNSTYFLLPCEEGSFRLVNHSITRPVPKLSCILAALPTFAQTRILRAGAERMVKRLKEHIVMPVSKTLETAMRTSPRAPVYEAIREHLVGETSEDSEDERIERFYSFDEGLYAEALMPYPT